MKKLIAMTSVVMCIGFSIALANSNDTSQNPGTSGSSSDTSGMNTDTSTTGSTSQDSVNKDSWKTASTCTTEKGEVLHRTDKGFKNCIKTMKKSGGMSGQSGSTTTETTTTEESNTDRSDMSGQSGSSDTTHSGY